MNIENIALQDIDPVAELFVMQAIHVKDLDDPYCDNHASIDIGELHRTFRGELTNLMSNNDALVAVAKEDERIVGFAIGTIIPCRVPGFLSKVDRVGYIDEAYVDAEHRRKGVLRKLEAYLLAFFKLNNLKYVELNFFTSNGMAKTSWNVLGYKTYMEYARKEI